MPRGTIVEYIGAFGNGKSLIKYKDVEYVVPTRCCWKLQKEEVSVKSKTNQTILQEFMEVV